MDLNGQKIAFRFYEAEFAWHLQYGREKESWLHKGKEKSPRPAYALGELHKVAFADEPGFERLETNCVK